MRSHVVLIGGRAGVGKTQAAARLHWLLSADDVRHALIEGDNLDQAHPPPWEHGLAERNLAAMWAGYRSLGYRRLIYTNTVAPLYAADLTAAMGDDPRVTTVLLRATDVEARRRLGTRESGAEFDATVMRSSAAAGRLDAEAGDSVHRIDTDGRSVDQVARDIRGLLGW